MTQARRHTGNGYRFTYFPARHLASLPKDRAAALPWLVVADRGGLLVTPWPLRRGGLTYAEEDAIQAMQKRIVAAQRAGGIPAATAFWIDPATGRMTPQTVSPDWVKSKLSKNIAVRLT